MIDIREGAYYRTAKGDKVGPAHLTTSLKGWLWEVGSWLYHPDGSRPNPAAPILTEEWTDEPRPVRPGDIVRCIDNSGAPDSFEVGKTYTVKFVTPDDMEGEYLHVEGISSGMFAYRFEPAPPHVRTHTVVEPGSFSGLGWAPHPAGIEVLLFDRAELETLSTIFADLAKTL